jgi:hypothetical protein
VGIKEHCFAPSALADVFPDIYSIRTLTGGVERLFQTQGLFSLAGDEVHKSIKFLFSLVTEKGVRESERPCRRCVLLTATQAARRDRATVGNFPSLPAHVGERGAEYS